MKLPVNPPVEPMLAKPASAIPATPVATVATATPPSGVAPGDRTHGGGGAWFYEPKWDGFRALVFRDGDEVYIQSRELKPLNRYFPELEEPLRANLPERVVLDGEIVIATNGVLDFDALLLRIHPAKSRAALLAKQTPASFVAFDCLSLGEDDLRGYPQTERRGALESALSHARPPVHLTPVTRDAAVAQDWFERFEGAGLDGVIAKAASLTYNPGKRAMLKIKHARTADCVVAGFRWYKDAPGELVGSLLLGLYDAEAKLQHVGIAASFTREKRAELARLLEPLRKDARDAHPWKDWAQWEREGQRMPGAASRWNRGKELSWEPVRIELVCEVAYDHLQGDRFRHATQFKRWRFDKSPSECRYDQMQVTAALEIAEIFGGSTNIPRESQP